MFVFVCTVHFMVEFVQTFRMHSMWMLLLCLVSNRKKKVFDVKLHDFFVRVIIGRMQQRRYNQKIDASALYRLILPKDNMKQSIRVHNIQKKTHFANVCARHRFFFVALYGIQFGEISVNFCSCQNISGKCILYNWKLKSRDVGFWALQ